MGFRRYGRSAVRKGRRLYKWGRANPKQAAAMARSALKGIRTLRGLVNSEKFFFDTVCNLGSNKARIFNLQAIQQADTTASRTGNSILARSLYMRGFMQVNPAVTTNTRICLVLLQDTQQIADTTPAVSDIFNGDDPEVMLNAANNNYTVGRFKIIWRKNYNVTPATASRPTIQFTNFRKLYSHIKYNGPASSDLQKNGYYLVMLTSEIANFPTISITTRLGYHDN